MEKVRKIVLEECRKRGKEDFYEYHIRVVEEKAVELAKKYNADEEIVRICALLHDIGMIKYGPEDHAIKSAEEARKILKSLRYPEEKTKVVEEIIRYHSGGKTKNMPKEFWILTIADAYAHFKYPLFIILDFATTFNKRIEALKWFLKKMERELEFLKEVARIKDEETIRFCEEVYERLKPFLEHFR